MIKPHLMQIKLSKKIKWYVYRNDLVEIDYMDVAEISNIYKMDSHETKTNVAD